jgi:MraZ protein
MFLGEFEHTIDEKSRITIPAKFRGKLAAGMVITKGIDNCLWLYPVDGWQVLAQKIIELKLTNAKTREFSRQVFGGAFDTEPDRQGRVNLPTYLREYANIDNKAVIVGLYDHCEIWNADHWRERQVRSHQDPEGRAALFESLGI